MPPQTLMRWSVIALSLLPTPLLVLISTSFDFFLDNQDLFGNRADLLLPFVVASGCVLLVGVGALLLASRPIARSLLWAYYLTGITYFVWSGLATLTPELSANTPLIAAAACVFVLAVAAATRLGDPRSIAPYLAIVGLLLLGFEISRFAVVLDAAPDANPLRAELGYPLDSELDHKGESRSDADPNPDPLPNIYHLVLDAFQTELFEIAIPQAVRDEELGGFHYFPDNVAVYGHTLPSLASIFLGRPFEYDESQRAYGRSTFSTPRSFLAALQDAGYATFGFHVGGATHELASLEGSTFDYSIPHARHTKLPRFESDEFVRFWVYARFPRALHSWVGTLEESDRFHARDLLPRTQQLRAYPALQNILELEAELPDHARYTFVHLMVPHDPFVLDADCSTSGLYVRIRVDDHAPEDEQRLARERLQAQSRCAGRMLLEFVERLRALGRLQSSLVVIHADHGMWAALEDGNLVLLNYKYPYVWRKPYADAFALARSRSLLLVKPPQRGAVGDPFEVSQAPSSLLDLAPTILAQAGIAATDSQSRTPVAGDDRYMGYALLSSEQIPPQRVRYFHYFRGKTRAATSKTIRRWRMVGASETLVEDDGFEIGPSWDE